jgi:hypothetical protein
MPIPNYSRCIARSVTLLLLVTGSTLAGVRLPNVFGDNMLLQRNQPVAVWGLGRAGGGSNRNVGKRAQYRYHRCG